MLNFSVKSVVQEAESSPLLLNSKGCVASNVILNSSNFLITKYYFSIISNSTKKKKNWSMSLILQEIKPTKSFKKLRKRNYKCNK